MANYVATGAGYDVTFELNEFDEPRLRSEMEVIKDSLLFILFSKPGQYPSLPQIGLDLQSELYFNYDHFDVNEFKNRLIEQCNELGTYINSGTIAIRKIKYKDQPSLLIYMEGTEKFPAGYKTLSGSEKKYYIGITFDELQNMITNINIA